MTADDDRIRPTGASSATPDGTPSGTLHEGAMDLVERLLPDDTPADLEEALRLGQAYLHSFGITAWQDAIVRPEAEERAYVALASRGELTGRVVGAMWWERHRGAEQIEEFVERRRATSIGRYQATSVKLMMDGVLENFTGAMLEPYGDGHGGTTDNRGLLQIDPEGLASWVPQLDALGFQPHFHAIGDRAVRASLDAVEAARRANAQGDGCAPQALRGQGRQLRYFWVNGLQLDVEINRDTAARLGVSIAEIDNTRSTTRSASARSRRSTRRSISSASSSRRRTPSALDPKRSTTSTSSRPPVRYRSRSSFA